MAIVKDITITVKNNQASLSEPVYLYLGDGGITLLLTLIHNSCKFGNFKSGNTNIVEEAEARWASVCVLKPDKKPVISDRCEIWDGKIRFEITKDFIDEIEEAGTHQLQVHLYDGEDENSNRLTMPPVSIQVLKPICDYNEE